MRFVSTLLERSPGWAMQVGLGIAVVVAPSATRAQPYRLYGLAILLVPALLAAGFGVALSSWQRGWLSLALGVHAFGALYRLYGAIPWYDHLAHVASAMLIAGVGYAVLQARGRRLTAAAHLKVFSAVVLVGIAWELWEMQVDYLTVYGPGDVVFDVAFDGIGWAAALPVRRRLVGRLPEALEDRLWSGQG